jgi:hypothetical protein
MRSKKNERRKSHKQQRNNNATRAYDGEQVRFEIREQRQIVRIQHATVDERRANAINAIDSTPTTTSATKTSHQIAIPDHEARCDAADRRQRRRRRPTARERKTNRFISNENGMTRTNRWCGARPRQQKRIGTQPIHATTRKQTNKVNERTNNNIIKNHHHQRYYTA